MAALVYSLCALASLICAFLLFRGYARNRSRLSLFTGLAFVAFFFNNLLLFVDMIVMGPEVSLLPYRTALSLIGAATLVYGCVQEVRA
jgi:hypothetical protein